MFNIRFVQLKISIDQMSSMKLQPRKTTFMERFQKAIQFYDFTYHLHKSTYKGLSSFYKKYSQVQRTYADSLINLSRQSWTEIPELHRENQSLITTIKQIVNCVQATSQLHFNYAQRLLEVSVYYNTEYSTAKKNKQNQMKILKDRNTDQYNLLRDREKDRNVINNKEKDICSILYNNLDKLSKEENGRIHNIKEQTIIYFSLYKKVCEKQLELTSLHNMKLIKQQFQVKNPGIAKVAEQLRIQHNQYGGEQIQRKSYDIHRSSMIFNRQSLRASMEVKERITRLTQNQDHLKKIMEKYQETPDKLLLLNGNDVHVGLFDPACFGKDQRRKYAREVNGQAIRVLAYDMLEGFMKNNSDSDQLMLLQLIKANLKYKQTSLTKLDLNTPTLTSYLQKIKTQVSDQQYLYHLRFIQELSKFVQSSQNIPTSKSYQVLDELIKKKQMKQISETDVSLEGKFSFGVKCCLLDILVDCVCVTRPNQPVLVEGYVDFMHIVAKFGEEFLGIGKNIVILLVLRKLDRLIVDKNTELQLEILLADPYFLSASKITQPLEPSSSGTISTWQTLILNNCTTYLLKFYSHSTTFLNHLKILLILEKLNLAPMKNFNARDHFYTCIRSAGFNFLKSSEQCLKIFDTEMGSGEQRLREIVECVEQLDYNGVIVQYLNPSSVEIAKLLGVGEKKVKNKLFEQFTQPLFEILHANLGLLSEHEGVDREGYVLRLGIIFAKLDLQNPQPINEYETFFKVLKAYLQQTEKDYDNMLEHSRKTELWIMEENALATPNCIDFCSLLYKPFEFLLISLKQLEKGKKTEYTLKYSQFIKLRLNTVLKTQIIKYINFLYESLLNYRNQCPKLQLKPVRTIKINPLHKQNLQKQKQGFKQLTRRLFNLLFLKQQLQEMISDFIQPQVYQQMGGTIFKVQRINKIAGQSPQYRDILDNTRQIVEAVMINEEKIVRRVAGITVFYHMSKLFENLYFQEEKSAIQQFFSNTTDYKLSEYTFLKYQQTLQDWFTLVVKNMPEQFFKQFSIHFSKCLYEAIQYQVLNSTKFKLPFKQKQVIQYLDSDITFVTTTMKQKFFDNNIIDQELKMPFKYLLADLELETGKLMSLFEASTLKNDKDKCKYVLTMLNLRVKEEKAMEFVKKYKTILST